MKEICPKCKIPYKEHTCYFCECAGCPNGHSSFHRTVIMSPEWKLWQEEQRKRMKRGLIVDGKFTENCYDIDECEAVGIIGDKHWEEFMKFSRGN